MDQQEELARLTEERRQLVKAMDRVRSYSIAYEVLYTRWREVDDRIQLLHIEADL